MPSLHNPLRLLLVILLSILALSSPPPRLPVRLIHEFPKPSWIENLAVRRNGSILVTEMSKPHLYQLNPFLTSQAPQLIHTFPSTYLGLLGITEIESTPDTFAVVSGNFSLTPPIGSTNSSYAVWRVDLRSHHAHPVISKISDLPQASFINGMVYRDHSLLLADSTLGLVFRLNLTTLDLTIAVNDLLMKKGSPHVLEGINGLKVLNNTMYFTNAYSGTFCRLPIHRNGTAAGPASIIAKTAKPGTWIFDDFTLDNRGNAFLATGTENVITEVNAKGSERVIAGSLNSTEVAGPTALAFGRTGRDAEVVYVTTGGALGGPVNGSVVVGAQVLAVDLKSLTK